MQKTACDSLVSRCQR